MQESYLELFETFIATTNSPAILDDIHALKMSCVTKFCSNVISCQHDAYSLTSIAFRMVDKFQFEKAISTNTYFIGSI